MPLILVGIDDPGLGHELMRLLGHAGHRVQWVRPLDVAAARLPPRAPDVIVVDGEAAGLDLAAVAASWHGAQPEPVFVVLAVTAAVRVAAERLRATVVGKPITAEALVQKVSRVAGAPRGVPALGAAQALAQLGLAGGGLPEDEAAAIVAGSRQVDIQVVREALRRHVVDYVTPTPLLDQLFARRVLRGEEAQVAARLDGGRTVKGIIDGGALQAVQAARLLWALVSGGAATVTPEPPSDDVHPEGRVVGAIRDHLRARRARLEDASHYDVLELPHDAAPIDIDRAAAMLAARFGPEVSALHDLGDLAPLVETLWQQIAEARAVLLDPAARQVYDHALLQQDPDLYHARLRRKIDRDEAEAAFLRGQRALGAGDVFRAVSELAAAARRAPEDPDYDVYAAWVRVLADGARGADRAAAARRERKLAEKALLGRRPRPRAMYALALIENAAGDVEGAKGALREALACDPRLAPARQMLTRLEQGS